MWPMQLTQAQWREGHRVSVQYSQLLRRGMVVSPCWPSLMENADELESLPTVATKALTHSG